MAILDTDRSALERLLILKRELAKRLSLPLYQYKPCDDPERDQLAFHKANTFWRLLFGGNQSGKSIAAAAEIAWFATGLHPYRDIDKPQKIWVLSASYRTIFEGIWRHLRPDGQDNSGMGFIPHHLIHKIGPKPPGQEVPYFIEVKFKTHTSEQPKISRIDFITGEGKEDARRKTQAAAVNLIAIDEEIDESIISELEVRTLATNGCLIGSMTLVRSEEWATRLEERFEEGDPDVFVVRLNTDKNEHLSAKQKQRVFGGMSDEELETRKYGKSKRRTGLVYPTFNTNMHMCEPFEIPLDWPRTCALDAGFRVFAGLWWAYSPNENRFYCYAEMYEKEIDSLDQVADTVRLIENHQHVLRFIDPAACHRQQDGNASIRDRLSTEQGISCIPAFNSVEVGILAAKRLLTPRDGKPGVMFFNTLRNFRTEIKGYKLKPDTSTRFGDEAKDKPIKKKDHLMDCFRYLANNDPKSPKINLAGHKLSGYQHKVLAELESHIDKIVAQRGKADSIVDPYLGACI